MRPPHALPRRRRARSSHGREARRAVIAGCVIAGFVAAAYAIGAGWQSPSMREAAFAHSPQAGDDNLITGSIVFVPVLGNTCRKNLIDNRTWRVREGGTVPCDQAFAESRQRRSGTGAATRLDVIRESFRKSSP